MITKSPSYTVHSTHCGIIIFKRKAGTGSHGGGWLCSNTTFKSLAQAKSYAARQWAPQIDCI